MPSTCQKCSKLAYYNVEGQPARFCGQHKVAGMINVRHPRCAEKGCNTRPCYGHPNSSPTSCVHHQKPGFVFLTGPACIECGQAAFWKRPEDQVATFCESHADQETMENTNTWAYSVDKQMIVLKWMLSKALNFFHSASGIWEELRRLSQEWGHHGLYYTEELLSEDEMTQLYELLDATVKSPEQVQIYWRQRGSHKVAIDSSPISRAQLRGWLETVCGATNPLVDRLVTRLVGDAGDHAKIRVNAYLDEEEHIFDHRDGHFDGTNNTKALAVEDPRKESQTRPLIFRLDVPEALRLEDIMPSWAKSKAPIVADDVPRGHALCKHGVPRRGKKRSHGGANRCPSRFSFIVWYP